MKKTYRGFTFIEILVIVAIVALLVTVTIVSLMSAQNKATVNAYKTSMKSTQTALELCTGSGGTVRGGAPGDSLCGGTEKYPKLPGKCGNLQFRTGDLGGGLEGEASTLRHLRQ